MAEEKTVKIGGELDGYIRKGINEVLKKHSNNFTSKASGIVGVDPQIASHSLNINPRMKLIIQKKTKFTYERQKVITEEIRKLLDVGFIREVTHP